MAQKVELSREEQRYAWTEFIGSKYQRLLHNFLIDKISEQGKKLETAPLENVVELQSSMKAYRTVLAQIHAQDGVSQTHMYGPIHD